MANADWLIISVFFIFLISVAVYTSRYCKGVADYLAANRASNLDTIPRFFNLMPSRFSQRLAYLEGRDWRKDMWLRVFRRRPN